MTERRRATVTVTWDLDPVPGFNHYPGDLADRIKQYLYEVVPHYNPRVELTYTATPPSDTTVRDVCIWAYEALVGDGHPEFGEATVVAVMDTAGDRLTDMGVPFTTAQLRRIASSLA